MRYRAVIAYDGTDFEGFQRQKESRTVQGELEEALAQMAGRHVGVLGAGRTDTGVHASGQVIAFDLDWRHDIGTLRTALNAHLPPDIAVKAVDDATPDFHPRFDASSRTYLYRLYVADVRDPLRRAQAWHLTTPLDVAAMREASKGLIGTHDFTSFGSPPKGDNPVRTVLIARWDDVGDEQHFMIQANAFLYRMVRRIVGTLVAVGQGRVTPDGFRGILAARDRGQAASPAPAHGLTLVRVSYSERTMRTPVESRGEQTD